MEAKFAVNCYERKDSHRFPKETRRRFTLNLAAGVTPFQIVENEIQYFSSFYKIMLSDVKIDYFWYRVPVLAFKLLDRSTQQHVLLGGLLYARFEKAITLQPDPIEISLTGKEILDYLEKIYGAVSVR